MRRKFLSVPWIVRSLGFALAELGQISGLSPPFACNLKLTTCSRFFHVASSAKRCFNHKNPTHVILVWASGLKQFSIHFNGVQASQSAAFVPEWRSNAFKA